MRYLILFLFSFAWLSAQKVNFTHKINPDFSKYSSTLKAGEKLLWFEGVIESGCHVYGATQSEKDGPMAASLTIDTKGVELSGKLFDHKVPLKVYDDVFETHVYYFEGKLEFAQKLKAPVGCKKIKGVLNYQVCKGETCTMETYDFEIDIK